MTLNRKQSAGILLYRRHAGMLQVLLVHPGGPFWAKKDSGAWSIPKGEFSDEDPLACAKREFKEETGADIDGNLIPLKSCRLKSGKIIYAWAVEGDFDPALLKSNLFSIEWPPRSGKLKEFAEVDKAEWFDLQTAAEKINGGQVGFLEELREVLESYS